MESHAGTTREIVGHAIADQVSFETFAREIARHGRSAFYEGPIAKKILACSEAYGGVMTADDLAKFSSQWVEPISTTYRGWTVYEIPPNGQGIGALEMLNLMEYFPLPDYAAS